MKERRYILCPLVKIKKFYHHHHFFPLSLQRFQKIEFSETLSTKSVLLPPRAVSAVDGGSKARGLRETAFVPPNQDRFLGKKRTKKRAKGNFLTRLRSKTWQHFFSISCYLVFLRCRSKGVKKLTLTAKRWAIMSFYRVLEAL